MDLNKPQRRRIGRAHKRLSLALDFLDRARSSFENRELMIAQAIDEIQFAKDLCTITLQELRKDD